MYHTEIAISLVVPTVYNETHKIFLIECFKCAVNASNSDEISNQAFYLRLVSVAESITNYFY